MTIAISRKQALAVEPCKHGCGTEIQWAIYTKTERPAPLEVEPDSTVGNINLDVHAMTYIILNKMQIAEAIERGDPLFVNHLIRCPVLLARREREAMRGR